MSDAGLAESLLLGMNLFFGMPASPWMGGVLAAVIIDEPPQRVGIWIDFKDKISFICLPPKQIRADKRAEWDACVAGTSTDYSIWMDSDSKTNVEKPRFYFLLVEKKKVVEISRADFVERGGLGL